MRAVAEGELALLRKAKDAAHTHTNCFLPMLFLCLTTVIVGVVPVQFAAHLALEEKFASAMVLWLLVSLVEVGLILFAFQLYKAASMLVLQHASETGQYEPMIGAILRRLAAALPALLGTQLRSALDLRPTAFRENLLWPVLWAKEGLSGRKAIERSRELCRSLRGASAGLMLREYSPPLIGLLVFPAMMSLMAGGVLPAVAREAVSGTGQGWFFLLYPLMFGAMLLNYGAAFSFLYWSALRCCGEGEDVSLPAAARDESRSRPGVRPSTIVWVGLPLLLLAVIVVRSMVSDPGAELQKALNEGRSAAVLKYLSGGLPVDYRGNSQDTPLFEASRRGNRQMAEALLERGANVNARNRSGATALMMAVGHSQNEIARLLLDHGAAVNQANADGRTALMVAAMSGNRELVRVLLERGADPGVADAQHKTAEAYAREEGHGDIVQLLHGQAGRGG
jgi:ankyrin repeat protein